MKGGQNHERPEVLALWPYRNAWGREDNPLGRHFAGTLWGLPGPMINSRPTTPSTARKPPSEKGRIPGPLVPWNEERVQKGREKGQCPFLAQHPAISYQTTIIAIVPVPEKKLRNNKMALKKNILRLSDRIVGLDGNDWILGRRNTADIAQVVTRVRRN